MKTDAGREPGAVVVHLQHAAAAGRAVVGPVRFRVVAFLTIPRRTRRGNGDRLSERMV